MEGKRGIVYIVRLECPVQTENWKEMLKRRCSKGEEAKSKQIMKSL
jgi:hypothetical protein